MVDRIDSTSKLAKIGRSASSFRVSFELIISKFHFSHELFRPFPATIQLLGLASSLSLIGSSVVIILGAFVSPLSPMIPRSSLSLIPKFAMVSQDISFLATCCLLFVHMNAEASSSLEVVIVGL